MKKLVLILMMAVFALPAMAQHHHGEKADRTPEKRLEMKLRKMAEHLNLNDEQIAQIKPLMAAHQQKEQAHRQEAKAMREAFKADLAKVLSEEQMQELDKLHEKRKHKMREKRHHRKLERTEAEEE